jgi:hypothetical protein
MADRVRKEFPHGLRYEDRDIHVSRQPEPPAPFIEPVPSMTPVAPGCADVPDDFHPPIGSILESDDGVSLSTSCGDFIRVTDDQ